MKWKRGLLSEVIDLNGSIAFNMGLQEIHIESYSAT